MNFEIKMGRPKLRQIDRKDSFVTIRLKSSEKEILKKMAENSNEKVSDWIRKILLKALFVDSGESKIKIDCNKP